MSCMGWQDRLEAYVDAELPSAEMEAFRAHAASCHDCAVGALALIEAKAALRRAGRRYSASPDLRARVVACTRVQAPALSVESRGPIQRSRRLFVVPQPRWALAVAAVLLVGVGLYFVANRYQQPKPLAEFADLHVAALASANPVEVVSTDRHTVKPWFQGRIPFTFDLPELQDLPFTLSGGGSPTSTRNPAPTLYSPISAISSPPSSSAIRRNSRSRRHRSPTGAPRSIFRPGRRMASATFWSATLTPPRFSSWPNSCNAANDNYSGPTASRPAAACHRISDLALLVRFMRIRGRFCFAGRLGDTYTLSATTWNETTDPVTRLRP